MNHFRSDLFYRLNVLSLHLPTLEERKEDIPFLAIFFLAQEKIPHEFSEDALEYLMLSPWPGNIRHLKNHVERASVFVDHYLITKSDLEKISSSTLSLSNAKNNLLANTDDFLE